MAQNTKKKESRISWGFWGGASLFLAVAIALVCVMGWRTSGFKDWTFGFGEKVEIVQEDSGAGSTIVSFSEESENELMTLSLVGESRAQSNSYTLRATIKPENATNKGVTWETSDPQWVSVTPVQDDPLQAVITRISDTMGETVTITCRSVENPDIFATCAVDWLIGVKDVQLIPHLTNAAGEQTFELKVGETYTVTADMNISMETPGMGTLIGDLENYECSIFFTQEFIAAVKSYETKDLGYLDSDYDGLSDTFTMPSLTMWTYGLSVTEKEVNDAFAMAVNNCGLEYHAKVCVFAEYCYEGVGYGYVSSEIYVTLSADGLLTSVNGVDLDQSHITFTSSTISYNPIEVTAWQTWQKRH